MAVELEANTELATAGYFQLQWSADGSVELQESTSENFSDPRTIYTGLDRARVVSGKPDGDWYYRVRSEPPAGTSSDIVMVTVRHHPFGRAISYFVVGAVVFFATLYLIVTGARHRA